MTTYQGQVALITGASEGIGRAFARQLAAKKATLVLVARSADKLEKLAGELTRDHGVRVEVIAADLTAAGAVQRIRAETAARKLQVDILINNAGLGNFGVFVDVPVAKHLEGIALNVAALTELTYAYLPEMVARGRGSIVNVASIASFQPIPYMAVYGATKAFVLSFSEALWAENRRSGVRVLCLCPGATETAFFAHAGEEAAAGNAKATPEGVVATGLRALERDRSYVITGMKNYLLAQTSRFFPRSWTAVVAERMVRPPSVPQLSRRSAS